MPSNPAMHRGRAVRQLVDTTSSSKQGRGAPAAAAAEAPSPEPKICRICWAESDAEPGGQLISPCNCSGTSGNIHVRCLRSWQRSLRDRGMSAAARRCEVCKAVYDDPALQPSPPLNPAAALHQLWQQLGRPAGWPFLAVRAYVGYLALGSVVQSVSMGSSGFMFGMSVGKLLLEHQVGYLTSILGAMSQVFGCPLAEIIWINGFGALLAVMLSQVIYTSAAGLLGGMLLGFCTGYVRTLTSSVKVMSLVTRRVWCGVSKLLGRSVHRLLRAVLRV